MAKKKHKLPKFPPQVIPAFKAVCEALPVEYMAEYRKELDEVMDKYRQSAEENPAINIGLAEELTRCASLLLDHYEEMNLKQRALAVGAIRYFAIADNALPAAVFTSGMYDDAKVMNHVLEELGLEEHCIKI